MSGKATGMRPATYQDVLDAPPNMIAEIVAAQDDDPVSIPPFEASTFSLGELWP